MYTVYADGNLLYHPYLNSQTGEYTLISPTLSLELNRAGSFQFTILPQHPLYDSLNKLTTIVTVYDDSEELFRGRILNDQKDMYNQKNIYCEGELAFFLDSIIRPYSHTGSITEYLEMLLENHNSQVEYSKQFQLGNVTVTDSNDYIVRSNESYTNTWSEMNEKLIGNANLGGYLRIRVDNGGRYLDYIEDYDSYSNQLIEFGSNLLDITEYVKADDLFTCLIPLGASIEGSETNERLTIESVNDGYDFIVNETGVELFGYIWRTESWDDVTIASNLKEKAETYLENSIEMAVSLDIKALDLHILNVDADRIKVGDSIRVMSRPHGLNRYFTCSAISLDLINPESNSYTLGLSFESLTDYQTGQYKKYLDTTSSSDDGLTSLKQVVTNNSNSITKIDNFISNVASNDDIDNLFK